MKVERDALRNRIGRVVYARRGNHLVAFSARTLFKTPSPPTRLRWDHALRAWTFLPS